MDLKESVRREARRLGFSRLGFAATGWHPAAARLRQWLDSDFAGDMVWLHRRSEERSDTARLIPWARTILVAALPYFSSEPESSPSHSAGISRYARGKDYHVVLKERLRRLGDFLSEISPGARSSPIVDTGALLEKPWAASAGLGCTRARRAAPRFRSAAGGTRGSECQWGVAGSGAWQKQHRRRPRTPPAPTGPA